MPPYRRGRPTIPDEDSLLGDLAPLVEMGLSIRESNRRDKAHQLEAIRQNAYLRAQERELNIREKQLELTVGDAERRRSQEEKQLTDTVALMKGFAPSFEIDPVTGENREAPPALDPAKKTFRSDLAKFIANHPYAAENSDIMRLVDNAGKQHELVQAQFKQLADEANLDPSQQEQAWGEDGRIDYNRIEEFRVQNTREINENIGTFTDNGTDLYDHLQKAGQPKRTAARRAAVSSEAERIADRLQELFPDMDLRNARHKLTVPGEDKIVSDPSLPDQVSMSEFDSVFYYDLKEVGRLGGGLISPGTASAANAVAAITRAALPQDIKDTYINAVNSGRMTYLGVLKALTEKSAKDAATSFYYDEKTRELTNRENQTRIDAAKTATIPGSPQEAALLPILEGENADTKGSTQGTGTPGITIPRNEKKKDGQTDTSSQAPSTK